MQLCAVSVRAVPERQLVAMCFVSLWARCHSCVGRERLGAGSQRAAHQLGQGLRGEAALSNDHHLYNNRAAPGQRWCRTSCVFALPAGPPAGRKPDLLHLSVRDTNRWLRSVLRPLPICWVQTSTYSAVLVLRKNNYTLHMLIMM